MRSTKEDLIKRIADIEDQLRALRFEVEDWDNQEQESQAPTKKFYTIGDRVQINNPRFGQDKEGVVIRANFETGWVTVQTSKGKVRQQYFNISPLR